MLSTRLVYFVIDIVYIAFLREKLSKLRRAAVRDAKIGLAFSREPKFHKRTWRHIKTIVGKKKKKFANKTCCTDWPCKCCRKPFCSWIGSSEIGQQFDGPRRPHAGSPTMQPNHPIFRRPPCCFFPSQAEGPSSRSLPHPSLAAGCHARSSKIINNPPSPWSCVHQGPSAKPKLRCHLSGEKPDIFSTASVQSSNASILIARIVIASSTRLQRYPFVAASLVSHNVGQLQLAAEAAQV